jgi:hypothetical protein
MDASASAAKTFSARSASEPGSASRRSAGYRAYQDRRDRVEVQGSLTFRTHHGETFTVRAPAGFWEGLAVGFLQYLADHLRNHRREPKVVGALLWDLASELQGKHSSKWANFRAEPVEEDPPAA